MTQKDNRIHSMDTIRGLASLEVLIHHSLLMSVVFWEVFYSSAGQVSFLNLFTFSPLHIFWAGHEAVVLFFVMSGFVLSIPYYSAKKVSYGQFFIKRIFRIYGPYLVAVSIALLCNQIYSHHGRIQGLSDWFNDIWKKDLTVSEILNFGIFNGNFHNVATSLWSIPVEIKISFVFPFIVKVIKKLSLPFCLLLLLGNISFYMIGKRIGLQSYWGDFSLFYYLTFFLCGTILYKYREELLLKINRLKMHWIYLLLLFGLFMYTYHWNILWLPPRILSFAKILPADYMACLAALIFIILSLSQRAPKWLFNKYLVFLGQISFSLYLIHPIIIGLVGFTFGPLLPVYIIIPLCLLLSILLAIPFYKFIESPLQNLGRSLSTAGTMRARKAIAISGR